MEIGDPRCNWATVASHVIGDYFDVAKPLIDKDYDGLDPHIRFVSTQLFIDCHLTTESVLLLVDHGKEWDADILARAVVEGTLKYVYLMVGTAEEMKRKATEYWVTLPAFSSVKRSERARAILDTLPDRDDPMWQGYRDMLLSESQARDAYGQSNRRDRQMLDEQWSFSGLARYFAGTGRGDLKPFAGLAIQYANSSHMLHKDGDGVGMVWDRYRRPRERQNAITIAHAGRLISDACAFASLRLLFLLKACGEPTGCVREIDQSYEDMFDELADAAKHFCEVEHTAAD
jgi:hypothetical protein